MTAINVAAGPVGRVWFDAEVRPNRSLTPGGRRLVLSAAGLAGLGAGSVLVASGFWLAAGFLWFDLGLLACAMLACSARLRAVEHVRIDDDSIVVERHRPGFPVESLAIPAAWTRVIRVPHPQVDGLEAVHLRASGRTVTVAADLAPSERPAFADALEVALARRRAGLRGAAPALFHQTFQQERTSECNTEI